MEQIRDKTTQAFEKHIDHIALIQNGIFTYTPKKVVNCHYEIGLETYLEELGVRSAICLKTAEDISEILPFKEIKEKYKQDIKTLSSKDLDLTEFRAKKAKLDRILLGFAKLEFCRQRFFSKHSANNDLMIAGALLTILDKLSKFVKMQQCDVKTISVTRKKIYKYVKDASIEENNFNFKTAYEKLSLMEIIDKLFHLVVLQNYELENYTEETMVGVDGNNYIMPINIISTAIEEDKDFKSYKNGYEQEVYNWLIEEMHTQENGMVF